MTTAPPEYAVKLHKAISIIFSMLSLTGLSLQSGFAIQTIILPDCRLMSGLKELQNK